MSVISVIIHINYITTNLVHNISLRVSRLSANVDIFNDKAKCYDSALIKVGYNERVTYVNDYNFNSNYSGQNMKTHCKSNVNIGFYSNNDMESMGFTVQHKGNSHSLLPCAPNEYNCGFFKDYCLNNRVHSSKAIGLIFPFGKKIKFNFQYQF